MVTAVLSIITVSFAAAATYTRVLQAIVQENETLKRANEALKRALEKEREVFIETLKRTNEALKRALEKVCEVFMCTCTCVVESPCCFPPHPGPSYC